MVHLSFFVRKLSCAVTGSGVDHCRWHDFNISGFACFIQEEVDKGTLKLCTFSFVYRKTCSCDFNTQVEVYQIIFFCQFPVGKCSFGTFGFHSSHFLDDIVFGTYTFGYTVIRNIRNRIECILHIGGSLCHCCVQFLITFF